MHDFRPNLVSCVEYLKFQQEVMLLVRKKVGLGFNHLVITLGIKHKTPLLQQLPILLKYRAKLLFICIPTPRQRSDSLSVRHYATNPCILDML